MKDYTCHYVVSILKTNVYIKFIRIIRISKLFLLVNGYINTKKSFPICMFVVMASGKCDLHIHLPFLQEF